MSDTDATKALYTFLQGHGAVINVNAAKDDEGDKKKKKKKKKDKDKESKEEPKEEIPDLTNEAEEIDSEDTDDNDVALEIKAHVKKVEDWCLAAKKGMRTIGTLIPDNIEAEKYIVRLLGGYLAPQVRAFKQLESSWDTEGRDIRTKAGMVCTRLMFEHILAGLVEGLKLNQKEFDSSAKSTEKEEQRQQKNKELADESRGRPQMRHEAAAFEGENDDGEARTKEQEVRTKKIQNVLKILSAQFAKLLKTSLSMVPADAEVQLKGGIFSKGKRVPVGPYLKKLLQATFKVVQGVYSPPDGAVEKIKSPFVVSLYKVVIGGSFNEAFKILKRMVR
jgi:hypothetical protein